MLRGSRKRKRKAVDSTSTNPPQPPNDFRIRGLDEQRHPDHDRPQRWQPLVLETAYGDEYFDVGHGEASPAKAVQAAESRLFTVEVAKRRAG